MISENYENRTLTIVSNDTIVCMGDLDRLAKDLFEFVVNYRYQSTKIPANIQVSYTMAGGEKVTKPKTRDWDSPASIYSDIIS